MKNEKKAISKKMIGGSFVALLAVFLLVMIPLGIYQSNFGRRYETTEWMRRNVAEFDNLKSQKYTFESNKGQQLTGYTYCKEPDKEKGVIVIAHGFGGGGHNTYMDVADCFAESGYTVFAYDATGNDESEGDQVKGLPQGVIDLDYAIRFLKGNDEFNNMPIMLFGHSWGAYSVGSVLNLHTDIKAVAMVAGFNKSIDMIKEEGTHIVGNAMNLFVPSLWSIEKIKFGEYSSYNCIDGFEKSDSAAMIIHSVDDTRVSFEKQYKKFQKEFGKEERFQFLEYSDRGHNYVFYSDAARKYMDDLNSDFNEFKVTSSINVTPETKTKYMIEHLDKKRFFELDKALMEQIVSFYDKHNSAS